VGLVKYILPAKSSIVCSLAYNQSGIGCIWNKLSYLKGHLLANNCIKENISKQKLNLQARKCSVFGTSSMTFHLTNEACS